MDIVHIQPIVDQFLTSLQNQGPQALNALLHALQIIKTGFFAIGSVAGAFSQSPIIAHSIDEIILLIQSGAAIPDIAAALSQLATALGISVEALIQIITMVLTFVV